MHITTTRIGRWGRATVVALLFTGSVSAIACKDFLTADNPGIVQVDRLDDTSMVELMANSAIGSFQDVFPWMSYYSAVFTDELRNHGVFFEEGLFDQRRVQQDNGTWSFFHYTPLQRARWLADSMAGRIRTVYAAGDSALRDVRLARTYAFAGYGLLVIAEMLCEAPLAAHGVAYSRPYNTNELFTFAQQRFDSAIKIATASRAANAAVTSGPTATLAARYVLAADSIRNLAYVGMARAALGKGDNPAAIAAANLVTSMGGATGFEYRLYYSSTTALGISNFYQDRVSGGAGVTTGSISGTPFISLDDPRVPHPLTATNTPLAEAVQGTGAFVVPNSPPSFSSFNNTRTGADFTYGASIRLASLLEAQYILAEAGGAGGTNFGGQTNIAFVESRRTAFPSTTAATPTDATNYMDNLIDQRRRDFYLDGHRMGDLRRYLKFYSRDFWPTGPMYGSATLSFGTQMCFPLNVAEITNNPLVPKPYTIPPGP
jgi:hypothetical protein